MRTNQPRVINRVLFASLLATIGGLGVGMVMPSAHAAEPIGIGVIAVKGQILGNGIYNAAELAADQINASGGIDGRKIVLHEYDSHFTSTGAISAFQRAVDKDHVVAVTGISTSEVALATMPWAGRLKTPLLLTGAATTKISGLVHAQPARYEYVFDAMVNSANEATASCIGAREMRASDPALRKFDRVVILSENAAWTKPLDEAWEQCLPKAGLHVVGELHFALNTKDFSPLYNKIENDKANVIMAGVAHTGVTPVDQWHQDHVPALFSGVNGQGTASVFWKATNGATQDVITWNLDADGAPLTDRTAQFFKAYASRFHVAEPVYDAYFTYEAVFAIADALKRDGGHGGAKLVDALQETNFIGVLGRVAFHDVKAKYAHELVFNEDPQKGQSFVIVQWQNGKQVILWPQRLATGKLEIPPFVHS